MRNTFVVAALALLTLVLFGGSIRHAEHIGLRSEFVGDKGCSSLALRNVGWLAGNCLAAAPTPTATATGAPPVSLSQTNGNLCSPSCSSISATYGAPPTPGDLDVAYLNNPTSFTITPPLGWVLSFSVTSATTHLSVYTHTASAVDSTTVTFSFSGADYETLVIQDFANADTVTVLQHATTTTSGTLVSTPAIAPTKQNSLPVGVFGQVQYYAQTAGAGYAFPANGSQIQSFNSIAVETSALTSSSILASINYATAPVSVAGAIIFISPLVVATSTPTPTPTPTPAPTQAPTPTPPPGFVNASSVTAFSRSDNVGINVRPDQLPTDAPNTTFWQQAIATMGIHHVSGYGTYIIPAITTNIAAAAGIENSKWLAQTAPCDTDATIIAMATQTQVPLDGIIIDQNEPNGASAATFDCTAVPSIATNYGTWQGWLTGRGQHVHDIIKTANPLMTVIGPAFTTPGAFCTVADVLAAGLGDSALCFGIGYALNPMVDKFNTHDYPLVNPWYPSGGNNPHIGCPHSTAFAGQLCYVTWSDPTSTRAGTLATGWNGAKPVINGEGGYTDDQTNLVYYLLDATITAYVPRLFEARSLEGYDTNYYFQLCPGSSGFSGNTLTASCTTGASNALLPQGVALQSYLSIMADSSTPYTPATWAYAFTGTTANVVTDTVNYASGRDAFISWIELPRESIGSSTITIPPPQPVVLTLPATYNPNTLSPTITTYNSNGTTTTAGITFTVGTGGVWNYSYNVTDTLTTIKFQRSSSSSSFGASGTSPSFSGLSATAGDVQVVFVHSGTNGAAELHQMSALPAGCALVDEAEDPALTAGWIGSYVCTSSLVANPTFTLSATHSWAGIATEFSGSSGVVDVHSARGLNSPGNVPDTSTSVTPTTAGDVFISAFGIRPSTTTTVFTPPAGGFTELASPGAVGSSFALRSYYLVNPALSSLQPSLQWTQPAPTSLHAAYVVLKPGVVAQPTPTPTPTATPTATPTPTPTPAPLAITAYGSSVLNGTLTTASTMSSVTGGTETSKETQPTGAGNFAEIWSQGNASLAAVAAIPSTPTGHGWVYNPGAGTIASATWSATANLQINGGATNPITMRFFKYSGGTYTSIGSATDSSTYVTGTKLAYTFSAAMPSVIFASGDLLYVDLWSNDPGGVGGDQEFVYESSSATAGVANDVQVSSSGGATPTPTPPPSSGLLAGIVPFNNSASNVAGWTSAFCAKQPQLVEQYNTSSDNTTYASLTSALNSQITAFSGKPMMWSIYSTPKSLTLASVAAGSNGDSAAYTTWANSLLSGSTPASDGNIYVRTDWEVGLSSGTATWQTQGNTDPTSFKGAFQRFANAFHAVSPKFKIVWDAWPDTTPSGSGGTDNSVYYPGDAYVDVISQDVYINGTAWSTGDDAYNYKLNTSLTRNGLTWMNTFANAHGKPMAISEWNSDNNAQGDTIAARFSTLFFAWMKAHNFAYEMYYDIGTSRLETGTYPLMKAVFQSNTCP